jgi:hypothetical protein
MYVLRATNDKKFYEMAVDYLEAIERISKIKCGFATVNDVLFYQSDEFIKHKIKIKFF